MNSTSRWTDQSAQQLVRYEALFTLLDEIQSRENLNSIAECVAKRWKYFSNVTCWRLTVADENGYQIIDGARGEATVSETNNLSNWDANFWQEQRPRIFSQLENLAPPPPEHFKTADLCEIEVLPFSRADKTIALLTVAARRVPFSELDKRFIHLFGGYFVDRITGITLRKAALASLTQRATYDSLTELYQRAVVIERLQHQLAHSQRVGQPLSVVIADVDYFKKINDTFGHLAGDHVLHELGKRFSGGARKGEIVGRYGGEEFLLILYPCSQSEAFEAAQRFHKLISCEPFTIPGEKNVAIPLTISFGVYSTNAAGEISAEEVLHKADAALYQAKKSGRNQIVVASS